MEIPQGITVYLGKTEEEIKAVADEIRAGITTEFTNETRRIELLAIPVSGGGFAGDILAQMQLVGIELGVAYFLRADTSDKEKDDKAMQQAIQQMMESANPGSRPENGNAAPVDATEQAVDDNDASAELLEHEAGANG